MTGVGVIAADVGALAVAAARTAATRASTVAPMSGVGVGVAVGVGVGVGDGVGVGGGPTRIQVCPAMVRSCYLCV